MRISLKWLAEYVALPPVDELAQRLTFAGIEVEGVHQPGKALAGVRVAQIKESAPHPNADKLSVTQVDAGGHELLQVVCGAKNYKVGDKVPLATVGTHLPNGMEIKKAQLRGVESLGMLCSQKELGLSEDASGLYVLDPALKPGQPIAEALGLDDVVLELNVTPNRPDALCHVGIAREVHAITGAQAFPPQPKVAEGTALAAEKVKIRIEAPERCLRYGGRVVEGVKVGPSPRWLARRLEACGVRSINNVVDVTNYVLLEYGQPMHGFDLDRIGGSEIVVRCAKPNEKLTTLDGKARALDADDLLICDRDAPLVIAGVMGGASSEVSEKTTRVLLEAANFQPATVRRSAKRHGLHTESSHRFERGVDVSAVPLALDRAAALIAELAGGTVAKGRVDVYPRVAEPKRITLRSSRVGELLGAKIAPEESRRILEALGFKVEAFGGDAVTYTVPTARVDVQREEDLVEEVARIRGYDSIPLTLPALGSTLAPEPKERAVEERLRDALSSAGFDEVVNYSFVAPAELQALGDERPIAIKNPLSVEQSAMRTTLLVGLLQNVSRNVRHQVETVRLYELGRTYHLKPGPVDGKAAPAREVWRLGGIAHGRRNGRTWSLPDEAIDFHDAKGAVEAVLAGLGVSGARYVNGEAAILHPRAAADVLLDEQVIGVIGQLHPKVAKAFDAPPSTYFFQLDLEPLVERAKLVPVAQPLPRFPAVLRDVAVVVDTQLSAEAVAKVIREVGGALLESAAVFDVYVGEKVPAGRKNLAFALAYRSAEKTLTDVEVNAAHEKIVAEVQKRLGGSLRGAK